MRGSLNVTTDNVNHEETKLDIGGSDEQQDDCKV